jgi:hypothetical protein
MAHVHGDNLSGQRLRLAMDRTLTNGEAPKKRRVSVMPADRVALSPWLSSMLSRIRRLPARSWTERRRLSQSPAELPV